MVYYNEFNAQKAAWLRQNQADGLIAEGMVDESDVRDVIPSSLTGYRRVHLFAGIGGWDYALRLANWPEHEPIWTASFPCQPFSAAGRRRGVVDDRHLWPYGSWLIEQCRPRIIVGEQVASIEGLQWFDIVSSEMEPKGYTVGTIVLPAACVGSTQIRHRQFWVAYSNDIFGTNKASRLGSPEGVGRQATERKPGGVEPELARHTDSSSHFWSNVEWVTCYNPIKDEWCARPVEPGVMPLAYGVPNRVVKIAGYGDAIVPQVAAAFLKAVKRELGLT